MPTHPTPIDNIIKEIHSIQKKKSSLALKESMLFWTESALWFSAKKIFFSKKFFQKKFEKKFESWKSFLRELKVPLFTVETKVTLYKKWINDLGYKPEDLADIPIQKLYRAIPHANTRKTAAKILVKARELSYSEFFLWLKKHST